MRRRSSLLLLGPLCALGACADDDTPDAELVRGEELYGRYCALCHGAAGEGYRSDQANALSNPQFLAAASDELLRTGTARGRPGTPMSPWGEKRGGPLEPADVAALVRWMRHWQSWPSVPVDEAVVIGSVARAEPLYELRCQSCHGARGVGDTYMSVSNPELLAVASDGFLRYSVARGRDDTAMVGYQSELTTQAIDDLVVLMRSWQEPVDSTPFEAPSADLGEVFINPGGPEPDWEPPGRFIGVDVVKQAIDDGEEVALLDARPPSDYVHSHISGARSVPFYLAESYRDQLAPDHWYVTYCGCPHSISGQLYDLLQSWGFPKVKVLDEGFFVWQERGYPVSTGPEPYGPAPR